ncbi:hypothetical protein I0511_001517 [Salmonella enterica]|nr:hypothetical protein [Salmonella enterica]
MSNTNSGLLGIKDIVFMNVIAILSLRQIPNVAPYGASAMLLWVIAVFSFSDGMRRAVNRLAERWRDICLD